MRYAEVDIVCRECGWVRYSWESLDLEGDRRRAEYSQQAAREWSHGR
jgi:hypothetical protein